ncbi:MAG: 50S ribosomal protein L15e [archaeon]
MSLTKSLQETFVNEYKGVKNADYNYRKIYLDKLVVFRREKLAVVKLEKPSNLARARRLGYKAKQGVTVVRARVRKGSGLHRRVKKGRRPKRMGKNKLTRVVSIKRIAEQRASRKYPNLEVLNSYFVGMDGQKKYYEVILVDPMHPSIQKDKELNWIALKTQKGRAERGLTSAGKKGRGLRKKGKGSEKARITVKRKYKKGK